MRDVQVAQAGHPGARPDAALRNLALQLRRLAVRPLLGLARAGSYAAEGSGEIGLAFTTSTAPAVSNEQLDQHFAAAYEAAREAVYNCLVAARPAQRLDGSLQDAFPIEAVRRLT